MIEVPVTLTSTGGAVSFASPVPLGYTKNKGVYRLLVTAEGEWQGLTIRCFWHLPGGTDPASSLVQDGFVDVPASVTAHPGNGCITFEGSDGVKTVTSADLRYRVGSNSGTEDGTMPEPGEPAWEQLVGEVEKNTAAALEAVQKQIGNLDDLTTKAKETLVAAINEAARTGSGGAGSITMRTDGGYIQYSTDDGSTWENLIALAELKGEPGENGADGAPGQNGADGAPGADGYSPTASVEQSTDGAKITITDKNGTTEAVVKNGKDGANGRDGADGQPGRDGVDGQPGKDGTDGITPTIGDNGNWFLGATDTGKPSRGATGDTGPQGPAGKDGAAGTTPNIQIGTVTTLPAGSQATASMSGTAEKPLLNLGIPKGADGAGGEPGVFSYDLLAEGTIAAGLDPWTGVDTGLTVADLREYRSFVILVSGGTSGGLYYDFGANVGSIQAGARFVWEDAEKTILKVINIGKDPDSSNAPSIFVIAYNNLLSWWGDRTCWIRSDFRGVDNSRAVKFGNVSKTTGEATYQFRGWIK